MKKPPNTRDDPDEQKGVLADALFTGLLGGNPSRAIERQEARGQQSFVESETLPRTWNHPKRPEGPLILQKAGAEFLGPVEGDDQFEYVRLPEGWRKVPTEHHMWSNLLDEKGRVRAAIFYKAAFYDRGAHISLERRYSYARDWDKDKVNILLYHAQDQGQTIWSTPERMIDRGTEEGLRAYYRATDEVRLEVEAWLDREKPAWRDPGAYWD